MRTRLAASSWEWALFVFAILLLGGLVVETVLIALISADTARALITAVGTEMITGREGGIAVALSEGIPPPLAFQYSVTQDLGTALLVYPIFLHLIDHYHDRDNLLMRRLRRIEASAQRHQAYVHRWGPFGVFLFMLLPFLVNGPLVGLVLGRLAGIPTPYLLLPVAASTAVAAAAWVFLYDNMLTLAATVHPRLGSWIAFSIVGLILVAGAIDFLLQVRRSRSKS